MQNVLPTFKTFQLDKDAKKRKDKSRQWDPSSSLPRIHKTPTFLKEDFEPKLKASPVTSYHISDSAAPNKRYLESSFPQDDRPEKSPLCDSERGDIVPARMKPAPITSSGMRRRDSSKLSTAPQIVRVQNSGGMDAVHVFFAGAAIKALEVRSGQTLSRLINGGKVNTEGTAASLSKVMDFYLSTTRRLVSVMSLRQEICEFDFEPGPLGIEVQLRSGKLCCTSVSAGSQAEAYSNIKDSEPLSINGVRVVTLRGFEEALKSAQEYGRRCGAIRLQALTLKPEKLPFDDMIGVTLKNKKVSNLFKNVLNKGKGSKRGGRFQNMTLEDSDDDDDDDVNDRAESKQDNVVVVDSSVEVMAEGKFGTTADSKDDVEEIAIDTEQKREGNAWTFVSDSKDADRSCTLKEGGICEDKLIDANTEKTADKSICDEDKDEDEDDDDFDDDDDGSVNSALLADPNRLRNTASILNSIALGIDPVITPLASMDEDMTSPQKELHSIPKSECDTKDIDAEQIIEAEEENEEQGLTTVGWDYATALENGDMTAHLKLIGVPQHISSSQNGWGKPSQSHFMNFMNISSKWDIELFWVGEDSALISRSILELNENHVELLSPDHVWCLTARRHDVEELDTSTAGTDDNVEVVGESSVSILFRPPKKTAENVIKRCVRVMWIPWVSLSFAETSTQLGRNDTNEYPDLDFKIFDNYPADEENKSRGKC